MEQALSLPGLSPRRSICGSWQVAGGRSTNGRRLRRQDKVRKRGEKKTCQRRFGAARYGWRHERGEPVEHQPVYGLRYT